MDNETINRLVTACLQALATDDFYDKALALRELDKAKKWLSTVSTGPTTTV